MRPTTHTWDPTSYSRFERERRRPWDDLLAAVGDVQPRTVVDLGCGGGALTAELAGRWPQAHVIGLDPSPEMIASAREREGVTWRQVSAEEWDPAQDGPIDLLVTNATLQWVPTHRELLPGWLGHLAPGGVFAMQVPGNHDAPSHALMRDVAAAHPRADELLPALDRARASGDPLDYAAILHTAGLEPDVWETTYVHVLPGHDDGTDGDHRGTDGPGNGEHPVLSWIRSTGLRPVQRILTDEEFTAFCADYEDRLWEAYPRREFGVALPYRRVFAVGRTP